MQIDSWKLTRKVCRFYFWENEDQLWQKPEVVINLPAGDQAELSQSGNKLLPTFAR